MGRRASVGEGSSRLQRAASERWVKPPSQRGRCFPLVRWVQPPSQRGRCCPLAKWVKPPSKRGRCFPLAKWVKPPSQRGRCFLPCQLVPACLFEGACLHLPRENFVLQVALGQLLRETPLSHPWLGPGCHGRWFRGRAKAARGTRG